MPRRLFNALTLLSLTLCLLALAGSVDSYRHVRRWVVSGRQDSYHDSIRSGGGVLSLERLTADTWWDGPIIWIPPRVPGEPMPPAMTQTTVFHVDYRLVAFLAGILPGLWLVAWSHRRQPAPGACQSCGYDLSGNVSGRCPECGRGVAR